MSNAPEVAILAGRGKTGQELSRALEAAGASARVLGRADTDRLAAALAGCTALYLMAPNMHPEEPTLVADALAAAEQAEVRRVVYHSVAAPYVPAMAHHLGKARGEDLVRRSGAAWTILQPCAYLQNLLPGLREADPMLRVPYDPDQPFGLLDLVDLAEIAARVLLEDGHVGATYEVGGPDLVTVRDVAQAAAEVLGRTVPVEHVPAAAALAAAPESEREWLHAMFEYYDRHGLPAGGVVTSALLGRSGTSLADSLARELLGVPPVAQADQGPATGRYCPLCCDELADPDGANQSRRTLGSSVCGL